VNMQKYIILHKSI